MRVLLLLIFLVGCSGHDCSDCYEQQFYLENTYYCDKCLQDDLDAKNQIEPMGLVVTTK